MERPGAVRRQVHFGGNVAAICRGMRQAEVARLFARECTCVRAYNTATGEAFTSHLHPHFTCKLAGVKHCCLERKWHA